jgi:hypothetical protein
LQKFAEGGDWTLGVSASRASLEEAVGGGQVVVLTGLDEEEIGDELVVAADEAELAAEFLFVGGEGTPSPRPVREGAV